MTGAAGFSFQADCSRCAALCCLALAIDRSDQFAIDKPAGLPCPHLGRDALCSIHDELETRGFTGCVRYDCRGAGQIVTEDLFSGQSWQTDPTLSAPMMSAFATMRQIVGMAELLTTAAALALPAAKETERLALLAPLAMDRPWSRARLDALDCADHETRVSRFITSLRDHVTR